MVSKCILKVLCLSAAFIVCVLLLNLFVEKFICTPRTAIWVYRNCPNSLMNAYGILVTKGNLMLFGKDMLPLSERLPGVYISRSDKENYMMYTPPTSDDGTEFVLYREDNKPVLHQVGEHEGNIYINNCNESHVESRKECVYVLYLQHKIFIIDFLNADNTCVINRCPI